MTRVPGDLTSSSPQRAAMDSESFPPSMPTPQSNSACYLIVGIRHFALNIWHAIFDIGYYWRFDVDIWSLAFDAWIKMIWFLKTWCSTVQISRLTLDTHYVWQPTFDALDAWQLPILISLPIDVIDACNTKHVSTTQEIDSILSTTKHTDPCGARGKRGQHAPLNVTDVTYWHTTWKKKVDLNDGFPHTKKQSYSSILEGSRGKSVPPQN